MRSPQRTAMVQWLVCWSLFCAASFLLSPIPGVNEPHYLCKARAFSDSTWCSEDFFLHSSHAHYVFYTLTGWLTSTIPFAAVAVCGRILSYGIVSYGWCRFASAAGVASRWYVCSCAVFAVLLLTGSLSGEWLIGGFESKVSAWGFCLLALANWMRVAAHWTPRRILGIGAWVGIAMSLHPVVGAWCLIAIVMGEAGNRFLAQNRAAGRHGSPSTENEATVLGTTGRGWRAFAEWLAGVVGIAFVFSLPGVIPALRLVVAGSTTHERQQIGNFIQVFGRLKHHLDPTTFPPTAWLWLVTMLVVLAVLLRIARGTETTSSAARRRLLSALAAAIAITVCGVLIGWHRIPAERMTGWAWRAALLKFYPFRLLDVLLPAVIAVTLTQQLSGLNLPRFTIGRGGFRLSVLPFLNVLLAATCLLLAEGRRHFPPASYTTSEFGDWCQVCDWIRSNTDSGALIVTPRESFAFKWFAERAEYFAYKDCPQDADGLIEWNRRNQFLGRWRGRAREDGRVDSDELAALAQETGGQWFISRWPELFAQQPVYSTQTWRVYSLQPLP